jgi:signal transduction histidine kinase
MRATLATKFSIVIILVLGLAIAAGLTTIIVAFSSKHLLLRLTSDEIPSIRAAEELESTFSERKDLLASYILENANTKWLQDLKTKQGEFGHWFNEARSTAHTETEKELLDRLQSTNRSFEMKLGEIAALSRKGGDRKAADVLINQLQQIYEQAYPLCESLIQVNMDRIDRATAATEQRASRWLRISVVGGALTICLGGLLIGMFFLKIIFPLRKMARTAKEFTAGTTPAAETLPGDELDAIGKQMRRLMANVVDTQSSLQQSQERLASMEKLASVGKLAASVAHELRNPLTGMKMWLYSLRKSVSDRPDLDEKLQVISDEITRLEAIIRNFLEFSRPPTLKRENVPLAEIVEKTLVLLQPRFEEKGLRLECDLPPQPIRLYADPQQFRQVLLNLLGNALDATPEGGQISLRAWTETVAAGRARAMMRIQDTGPGVPESVRQHIFEPFYTTKEGGTGLGLCIAANIIARHGGQLVLEESSNPGAVFTLWIPLAEEHVG